MSKGIAADYIAEMEQILDIDIVFVPTKTWSESLDLAKKNTVNFLFMSKSSERLKYFYYTEPFVFSPNMFIANRDYNTSFNIKNIENYNIGVLKAYSNKDYLILLYPQAKTKDYETIVEGLFDLSSGKIDLFLADLGQANYYINKYGINNLVILESLGYDFKFSFAVNKDYEILVSIFDKALDSMSEIENESILEKWISTDYKNWINRDQIKLAYGIMYIALACLFITMILIFILRKMVKNRTVELEVINKKLEDRVNERTKELKSSIDNLIETQNKLIQSEKYASLGYVVSRVEHELNTPMGNLLMLQSYGLEKSNNYTKIYNSDMFKKEDLKEISEIFESSMRNLDYIINVLERFKRLEATLISSYKTKINLKAAIELAIEMMYSKKLIPEGSIIETELEEVYIYANNLWIEEIVENLVLNSIEHNKLNQNHIQIISRVKDSLEITFRDYGSGIEPDIIEHIFEPFYKKSKDSRHSGLGLSIVYNIVYKNLMGCINVKSILNEVTEFVITIPIDVKLKDRHGKESENEET
ncbi:MAG: ATP-binding protein [Proteocatella sp.]